MDGSRDRVVIDEHGLSLAMHGWIESCLRISLMLLYLTIWTEVTARVHWLIFVYYRQLEESHIEQTCSDHEERGLRTPPVGPWVISTVDEVVSVKPKPCRVGFIAGSERISSLSSIGGTLARGILQTLELPAG